MADWYLKRAMNSAYMAVFGVFATMLGLFGIGKLLGTQIKDLLPWSTVNLVMLAGAGTAAALYWIISGRNSPYARATAREPDVPAMSAVDVAARLSRRASTLDAASAPIPQPVPDFRYSYQAFGRLGEKVGIAEADERAVRQPLPPAIVAAGGQAILFRRHVPPRHDAAMRNWFGGVPLVPAGYQWPQTNLQDQPNRPLSFLLQVDCATIPQDARLGLMPDNGLLQFFLDLQWGEGFGFAVEYQPDNGTPLSLAPKPAIARHYGSQSDYHLDWARALGDPAPFLFPTLPRWTFDPVALELPPPSPEDDDGDEDYVPIRYWPGDRVLEPWAWERLGEPAAEYADFKKPEVVRPFANWPHDWRAVQIAAGHMVARANNRFHFDSVKRMPDPAAGEADRVRADAEAREWFAFASQRSAFAPLQQEQADSFWNWLAGHPEIARAVLDKAATEGIETTLTQGNCAVTLPTEAHEFIRRRHQLVTCTAGRPFFQPSVRMLAPPSGVQEAQDFMGREHLMLLEIASCEALGHHLGEGVIQFWIKPDDLAARRFDRVLVTAEAY